MALAFDLRQLRYFVAVAESGSFRAAAERLHVSQPPLSRQVAELERVLGARLLDRSASGVTLTSAGRTVYRRADAILRDAEALAESVSKREPAARARLRAGITLAVTVGDRTRVAKAWARALPATAFELLSGPSRDLIPALKEGRLDFALVGLPGNTTGLQVREVQLSPLVAALPAHHTLARRRKVSLLDVKDLPLFWNPRAFNPAYHDFCLRYFRQIGYRPDLVTVEPGQVQTLERIAAGEGWTIPNGAMLAARVKGVVYRPLAEGEALGIRVAAAWAGRDEGGRYEKLATTAVKVLGGKRWREERLLGG
jgi:DNA-binding transcriptional LysR family regulator